MTIEDRETLLEVELVPDPDAPLELGPGDDNGLLSDEEVKGATVSLVRRKVSKEDLGHGTFGMLEIECSPMPPRGARFTFAQVKVRLDEPPAVHFIDVAPHTVLKPGRYTIAYEANGSLPELLGVASLGKLSVKRSREVNYEHCLIRGIGGGRRLAEWRIEEDPETAAGLGTTNALFMTVSSTGRVVGSVGVSARVARHGKAAAVRDLVLGRTIAERWHRLIVDIPSV